MEFLPVEGTPRCLAASGGAAVLFGNPAVSTAMAETRGFASSNRFEFALFGGIRIKRNMPDHQSPLDLPGCGGAAP
jgi:hypothetical protein